MAIAVYAGSFDPFTLGHLDVVKQAAPLFNKLVILVCENTNKSRCTSILSMVEMIEECCADIPNVTVIPLKGLVADFCKVNNCQYLVRGLRDTNDYLYEENIASINAEINPDLKTIYFRSRTGILSSSFIKELCRYGKDVSKYLPEGVKL